MALHTVFTQEQLLQLVQEARTTMETGCGVRFHYFFRTVSSSGSLVIKAPGLKSQEMWIPFRQLGCHCPKLPSYSRMKTGKKPSQSSHKRMSSMVTQNLQSCQLSEQRSVHRGRLQQMHCLSQQFKVRKLHRCPHRNSQSQPLCMTRRVANVLRRNNSRRATSAAVVKAVAHRTGSRATPSVSMSVLVPWVGTSGFASSRRN